jgi:hypothetical protein
MFDTGLLFGGGTAEIVVADHMDVLQFGAGLLMLRVHANSMVDPSVA